MSGYPTTAEAENTLVACRDEERRASQHLTDCRYAAYAAEEELEFARQRTRVRFDDPVPIDDKQPEMTVCWEDERRAAEKIKAELAEADLAETELAAAKERTRITVLEARTADVSWYDIANALDVTLHKALQLGKEPSS